MSKIRKKRRERFPAFYLFLGGLMRYANAADPNDIIPITIKSTK